MKQVLLILCTALLGFQLVATAQTISTSPITVFYCSGEALQVPFTISGSFVAGNTFTAQLSDAIGSFVAPISIGTLVSTNAGSITSEIPLNTPTGSGYRIRVVSDTPVVAGSNNATDIEVEGETWAGLDGVINVCSNDPIIIMFNGVQGSPDVGGLWLDPQLDPHNGIFVPGIDPAGCYQYIVTTPNLCHSDTSVHCYFITLAPNAGTNGNVTVCDNDPPFDLYSFLGGTPNIGGMWTDPANAVFSGWFDPSTDPAGCYFYTVSGTAPCPNEVATVCITVSQAPNAGIDFYDTVCTNTIPIPMWTLLGGSPDLGGSWADPNLNAHSGIFDPNIDQFGCYSYRVLGVAPCADDVSQVCILAVLPAANAGADSAIVVCNNQGSFDLINGLGGTPDLNGSWQNSGGFPVSSIFDPQNDPPGDYSYIVPGVSPCPEDTAVVSVLVDPCTSIQSFAASTSAIFWNGQDPNGSHNFFFDHMQIGQIKVLDLTGKEVDFVYSTGPERININMDGVKSGTYILYWKSKVQVGAVRFVHMAQ